MTLPSFSVDPSLRIYLTLAQYPILRERIRERMRQELFRRKLISKAQFEALVREQAVQSQRREGIENPFEEEPAEVWEVRLARVRSHLTDAYFASNLPFEVFENIVREVLSERRSGEESVQISFNPELAPQSMLLEQGLAIERLAPEERQRLEHRLQEIKVVLIRNMISDQLAYVRIARRWLTVFDLHWISKRKIGYGKIGGKAAGMLLAYRILNEVADDDLKAHLRIPESYFLGADLMYTFMAYNDLMRWADQKYKTPEEIRRDYPHILDDYQRATFPPDVRERLRELLETVGPQPLIVRSSSLLEDNFGTAFAGKYESHFCPNQGTPEENLLALERAIARVYASALGPDPLLYRRRMGLQDYDERIAILIQIVQGERWGRYYLPHAAGVAFARNLYRWDPQIRREDGFLRLVWGLGTRAVDRVGNDYPRLVALSHPLLRPEKTPKEVRYYSQRFVDVIDLEANAFRSLPVREVIDRHSPILRYLAQVYQDGYLAPLRSRLRAEDLDRLVINMDGLLRRTDFADRMRRMLHLLEQHYHLPVDMEFTVRILNPNEVRPDVEITILQCRPQSVAQESEARIPPNLQQEDIVFSTRRLVPKGTVQGVRYVLFVEPQGYFALQTAAQRLALRHAISRLNTLLEAEGFICVGPGRWGTTNPDLGVQVGFSDIFNARALVELTGAGIGVAPEPSFGTHFFQDLMEAHIYPLAVYLDDRDVVFQQDVFYRAPNRLTDWLPDAGFLEAVLRLIDVEDVRAGHRLTLVMDDEAGQAVAYLEPAGAARAEPPLANFL